MPGIKKILPYPIFGLLIAGSLLITGCAGNRARPADLSAPQGRKAFAILPVADYTYIEDVEEAHQQQMAVDWLLGDELAKTGIKHFPSAAVYRHLMDSDFIQPQSYSRDIKGAVDTSSLENLVNEGWSDMMKHELVDLIKTEKKRNIRGIAVQDTHLEAPETRLLDQEAVIEIGREFNADYIMRGRLLEYNLHQEYEWEPLRRNILPFLRGKDTLRQFGIAKAEHYDPLDNLFIGGALTDLGKKYDHGLRLQLWVQDASTGKVVWTNQREKMIGKRTDHENFYQAAQSAAHELVQDFLAQAAYDNDRDGVWNHKDRCPETPRRAPVDEFGCSDSDGDGVVDYLDKCPETPPETIVDRDGCPIKVAQIVEPEEAEAGPLDSDGDGIPDHLDECPDTPAGLEVDPMGCPPDSDGDGVTDSLDDCPDTPADVAVNDRGCPEIIEGEMSIELRILFDFDKAEIKPIYHDDLMQVADFLRNHPGTSAVIQGHTDSKGSEQYNLTLSKRRAESVKKYLVDFFQIDPARLTARGLGESRPVAANKTEEGRQKNRRSVAVITAAME